MNFSLTEERWPENEVDENLHREVSRVEIEFSMAYLRLVNDSTIV